MRVLFAILCSIGLLRAATVTNMQQGDRHTIHAASYDIGRFSFFGDYLAGYFDCYTGGRTNTWIPFSRSGGNLSEANEGAGATGSRVHKLALPILGWKTNAYQHFCWWLVCDNDGQVAFNVMTNLTNCIGAPSRIWDGSNYTNYAGQYTGTSVWTHIILGSIPGDSVSGYGSAFERNDAATNFAALNGLTGVELNASLWYGDRDGSSGWGWDETNATQLAFNGNTGGHPAASGSFNIFAEIIRQTGLPTNIATATLNWTDGSVVSTSRVAIASSSRSGTTLTFSWLADGMPPGFDVPDGTITNDIRNGFRLIPSHGALLRYGFQVTNIPSGTYQVTEDGETIFTGAHTQLANFFNMATNFTGPTWRQRVEVLGRRRDLRGADRVTVDDAHTAGFNGLYGADMINFYSHAEAAWDGDSPYAPTPRRGDDMIGSMQQYIMDNLETNYISRIRAATVQTNHTYEVIQVLRISSVASGKISLSGKIALQ